MLKNFLKYLETISRKFAKKIEIFDIVLYGSVVRGKQEPRDVDVIIIFNKLSLEKRMIIAQEFKEEIRDKIKNIDIKTMNLSEFFENKFLAKQGILSEGYSLISRSQFPEKMGFEGYVLFLYTLKNLNKNEKTKFIYALSGRNTKGLLEIVNAKHLGKGVIIVPINRSSIFEDFLKQWKINYSAEKILIEK